jgi:tetratricopeptide (TPR) repeat protein
MKQRYLILLAFLLLLIPRFNAKSQEAGAKYTEGVRLYSESKYNEAIDKWMELYNTGYRSASLDYNIGNAYFKINNVPGAILFYERAHLLKPADEDILYNLQIARTMAVDKFVEIPELFFVSWFNFLSLSLSSNLWAKISLITFILFLLLFSLYIYTSKYRFKVLGFWISLLMLLISISAFSFSSRNKTLVYNNPKAIIFRPLVNGKSSPDNSGTDLFVLHEGTKVTVEDEVGEWLEIRLSDGNKGWVPSNCLNKI